MVSIYNTSNPDEVKELRKVGDVLTFGRLGVDFVVHPSSPVVSAKHAEVGET
jgi:coproporphyrinogen III oxidase